MPLKKYSNTNKKRGVVFVDFNGVLSYKPFWSSLADVNHPLHSILLGAQQLIFGEDHQLVHDWMTGRITSEQIHLLLEAQLGAPKELYEIFVEDCIKLDVSQKIIAEIEKTNDNYHYILRTDNMDSFSRWTLPAHPELVRAFPQIYSSFELGFMKKSDGGKFFIELANNNGFAITECFLIDDSTSNCGLFNSLGGKALQTKSEQEVIETIRKLN